MKEKTKGSQWTKNPLPGPPMLWNREGPSFEPYCEESEECKGTSSRWTRQRPGPKKKGQEPAAACAAALAKVRAIMHSHHFEESAIIYSNRKWLLAGEGVQGPGVEGHGVQLLRVDEVARPEGGGLH